MRSAKTTAAALKVVFLLIRQFSDEILGRDQAVQVRSIPHRTAAALAGELGDAGHRSFPIRVSKIGFISAKEITAQCVQDAQPFIGTASSTASKWWQEGCEHTMMLWQQAGKTLPNISAFGMNFTVNVTAWLEPLPRTEFQNTTNVRKIDRLLRTGQSMRRKRKNLSRELEKKKKELEQQENELKKKRSELQADRAQLDAERKLVEEAKNSSTQDKAVPEQVATDQKTQEQGKAQEEKTTDDKKNSARAMIAAAEL